MGKVDEEMPEQKKTTLIEEERAEKGMVRPLLPSSSI